MRNIYGADFSGAMNPKIYYVHGILNDEKLTLKSHTPCDDRLDLFQAIVSSDKGIWGLDFPFSIPAPALAKLGFVHRDEMLDAVCQMTRKSFARYIAERLNDYPHQCREGDTMYCRYTDNALEAHSVFKTVNPNLRVMLYAGLKLLKYLSDNGVNVYPFGKYETGLPTVYEVYPSFTWKRIGMKRSTNIETFLAKFNDLGLLTVECEFDSEEVDNQDLADSIVACVMMATAYVTQDMYRDWVYKLPIFTDKEWLSRQIEGLIVRF